MPHPKKLLSSLLLTLTLVITFGAFFAAPVFADPLGDLFTTPDDGQSFTDFSPTDDLTINKEGFSKTLTRNENFKDFVVNTLNFVLTFLGVVAIAIVIYGGFLYVTAAGEEDRTQTGKKAITYATIGIIIILSSYAFVNTVIIGVANQEDDGSGVIAQNTGASFSALAAQVRTNARAIYDGFVLLSEVEEEIKGIVTDGKKTSLQYDDGGSATYVRDVQREDVLNYLRSTREKLRKIQNKQLKFSESYILMNDLIRKLETDIDNIQNIPLSLVHTEDGYQLEVDGDALESCEGFGEDVVNACKNYPRELYVIWPQIQKDLILDPQSPTNIGKIFEPLKQGYLTDLKEKYLPELVKIKQALGGVEAVTTGEVGTTYKKIMEYFGFSETTLDTDPASADGFLSAIENWEVDITAPNFTSDTSQISGASKALFNALKKQIDWADQISKLQTVIARLRADVTSGSAPLLVTFDVLNSVDPAGGFITDYNVDWQGIDGSYTFQALQDDSKVGPNITEAEKAVDCGEKNPTSDENDETFGPAFRQCTFKYPGTYIVSVRVKSNDPTKYLDGMSSLIIKVEPPINKIDLRLTPTGGDEIIANSYHSNGILAISKERITVTLDEGEAGIKFDASKTNTTDPTESGPKNIQNFRWDFGNGKELEENTTGLPDVQYYDEEGEYIITLEVLNKNNHVDRKILVLDVGIIAARMNITPNDNIKVGSKIHFDGTGSSASSGGKVKTYDWLISKIVAGQKEEEYKNDKNEGEFDYTFKTPGKYEASLKVTSALQGAPGETLENFVVHSAPPTAFFDYGIPKETQPSTVHFDASKSFDLDGPEENLEYLWTIDPPSQDGKNWEWVNTGGSSIQDGITVKDPQIKFKKKDDYTVTLKVTDKTTKDISNFEVEESETSQEIKIDNILDIDWASDNFTCTLGNKCDGSGGKAEAGKAQLNLRIVSGSATSYEVNFGDGTTSANEIQKTSDPSGVVTTIPHTYNEAGKFLVEITVFDDDFEENTIKRNVYIGPGSGPVAQIALFVNGAEETDLTKAIKVSKADVLTLDAGPSINSDGTGKKLKYSWDFDYQGKKSSSKSATHSYDELSPKDKGHYTVTLTVFDKDDVNKSSTDTVDIDVVNTPPKFSSLQAIPDQANTKRVTPLTVDLKAYNSTDKDGDIVEYKWWYYDCEDDDYRYGVTITQSPSARVTIGTNGKEGKKFDYCFALEIKDSDNATTFSGDILDSEQIPAVENVENGPNKAPVAKFNVDTSSVFVGEVVTLTSSSTDPDGQIVKYIWDYEGDGFFNNKEGKSSEEHQFNEKNLEGFEVKLKVVDNDGGETISDAIKIYVDSDAAPPKAAFKWQVVPNSGGKKIKFTNNSTSDEKAGAKIISTIWDFDTASKLDSADSDGDGEKDNDTDSTAINPDRIFQEYGEYKVKLTVTDNQGNEDTVEQTIKIPVANPPVAAFTSSAEGKKATFKNNSTADTERGAELVKFAWDFDTSVDSNGDGKKDNDVDSTDAQPAKEYPQAGTYQAKLTVTDNQGNTDDVTNEVVVFGDFSNDTSTLPIPDDINLNQLTAKLKSTPAPAADGIIYLTGASGQISFETIDSTGPISQYSFDKNIYFDSDNDGIKNNDANFETPFAGTWTTNFEKAWGQTTVKLTVKDIYGNTHSVTQEIKFK